MDPNEYARICSLTAYPSIDASLHASLDTFTIIKRQNEHRRLRAALRLHRQEKTLKRYVVRHGASSRSSNLNQNQNAIRGESISAIAISVQFSPCMLARILLEAEFGWSKSVLSMLFKDTLNGSTAAEVHAKMMQIQERGSSAGSDASGGGESSAGARTGLRRWMQVPTLAVLERVLEEIRECIYTDAYCSPLADRVRHNMGLEYEYVLVTRLRARGLVFESENVLREKGLSKTPDVRLLLPFGVHDEYGHVHVVNWIDSKAMFGDRHTHEAENLGQLQGYVNRYGPGMVIYWFGYVADLSRDNDIWISDNLPTEILLPGDFDPHMNLPILNAGLRVPMKSLLVQTVVSEATETTSLCTVPQAL